MGDFLEIKGYQYSSSIDKEIKKGELLKQLINYAESISQGKKVNLLFTNEMFNADIAELRIILEVKGILSKIEIINGFW